MDSNHPEASNISLTRERHILLLNYGKQRVIQLESTLIVLGRDPDKDIVIECDVISREHATFFRVPSAKPNQYDYRLIDGGPKNNRSKNGVSVNNGSAYMTLLEHGDIITFGDIVKGIYLRANLDEEGLKKYLTILLTAKEINEKTRDKIALMTRVFSKLSTYLPDDSPSPKLTQPNSTPHG